MQNSGQRILELNALRAQRAINVLRVASAVLETETVTINGNVYEVDTDGSVTAGRTKIDLSASATEAAATGTLTLTAAPGNGETVTIGAKVYTFQTVLTNVDGNVLIGGTAAAACTNLIAAVNLGAGSSVSYAAAMTANAAGVVAAQGAGTTVTITAVLKGTGGNAIATTETLANGSFGGVVLSGGVNATAAEFTTALALAINTDGNPTYEAVRISANEVLIAVLAGGPQALACTETLAGANNVWASATTFGGAFAPQSTLKGVFMIERAVTATEAALGTVHFAFPFTPSTAAVQMRSATGVMKAFDGTITISGRRVTFSSTGSVSPISTDLVVCIAQN